MRHKHCKAKRSRAPSLPPEFLSCPELPYGDEISQAFGHFFAFDLEMAIMHPKIGHLLVAESCAALRNLIFVMRKDEVDASAMNVKSFAKMLPAHRRAFDMPARAAASPRARPARLLF